MSTNETPFLNIMQQLKGLPYEEAISILVAAQCSVTRKLVKEEINKSHIEALKATCPPGLFEVLQKGIPCLQSY